MLLVPSAAGAQADAPQQTGQPAGVHHLLTALEPLRQEAIGENDVLPGQPLDVRANEGLAPSIAVGRYNDGAQSAHGWTRILNSTTDEHRWTQMNARRERLYLLSVFICVHLW